MEGGRALPFRTATSIEACFMTRKDQWLIWLFLAPSLLLLGVFLYWPMVGTFIESFYEFVFH